MICFLQHNASYFSFIVMFYWMFQSHFRRTNFEEVDLKYVSGFIYPLVNSNIVSYFFEQKYFRISCDLETVKLAMVAKVFFSA